MAVVFILVGFALFVAGVIALFKPLPRLWLKTRGMAAVAIVLSLVSCGIGGSLMPATTAVDPAPDTAVAEAQPAEAAAPKKDRRGVFTKITMAEYSALETGMSYAETVEIVGEPGVESSRSDMAGITTVAYTWQNAGGANAMVMFQNDELVQKSQFGLR